MSRSIDAAVGLGRLVGEIPVELRPSAETLARAGGKRIRSAMLIAAATTGRGDPERVERAAAVVELLHIATLLHDDVIDRAPRRRGVAAAHVVVGDAVALLTGLACFAAVGAEAAELGAGASLAVGETVAALAHGQVLDLERAFDPSLSIADYIRLADQKTAAMFRLACYLGAVEGRMSEADIARLVEFGTEVGIAFQVLDDCGDLQTRDPGKPAGTDHLLGLFGAPTLYALADRRSGPLRSVLLAERLGAADLTAVRNLVEELGGFESARRLASERLSRGRRALDGVSDASCRQEMIDLVQPVLAEIW